MSVCPQPLELRGPYDITNLYPSYWFNSKLEFVCTAVCVCVCVDDVVVLIWFLRGLLFDLSDEDAKEAVSSTCRSAVLHAGK